MSASVQETSLFAKFKVLEDNTKNRQKFTHGQYKDSGVKGTFGKSIDDDHQVACLLCSPPLSFTFKPHYAL